MHHATFKEYCNKEQHSKCIDKNALTILPYIASCANIIAEKLAAASCTESLGATGEINIQGECVQKLDFFSHTLFVDTLRKCKLIAGVASEEAEHYISFEENKEGIYIVNFDPLDGSSNLDVNINVGSIFSLAKKINPDSALTEKDFLQPMNSLIGAGYILYGPATILVLSLGAGVQIFTFSKEKNEFLLTHPDVKMPEYGKIYSVNEGYTSSWNISIRKAIDYFKKNTTKTGTIYSHRYVGSLVADIHRTLLCGGIFLYPTIYTDEKKKDKLRLLYEILPLSYIIEQAGGIATKGKEKISSIYPEDIHSRSAFYAGSVYEMNILENLLSLCDK